MKPQQDPPFDPFEFSLPPCTIILRHFPVCAYALHVCACALHVVSSNFVEKMLKLYYFKKIVCPFFICNKSTGEGTAIPLQA